MNKSKTIVLLEIDSQFVNEKFNHVSDALDYAKIKFQENHKLKSANVYTGLASEISITNKDYNK